MISKKKILKATAVVITLRLIVNFERRKDIRPNDFTKTFCSLDVANLEIFHSQIKKNERPRLSKTINILDFFSASGEKISYLAHGNNGKNFYKTSKTFYYFRGERFMCSIEPTYPSLFKKPSQANCQKLDETIRQVK